MLSVGIVGLPNVGKSTLFNALTAGHAAVENYPFTTIDSNVGVVPVSDPRLLELERVTKPSECVPSHIEFIDIAGLVRGASRGEGLGNQFLGNIRAVDALVHVLRAFEEPDVAHVFAEVDPLRDAEIVETELLLADLELLQRWIEKRRRTWKVDPAAGEAERTRLESYLSALDAGRPLRALDLDPEALREIKNLGLLSGRPLLYVANIAERECGAREPEGIGELRRALSEVDGEPAEVIPVSARIESELVELEAEERAEFLTDLGLERSGLERLVGACFERLGLIRFYTVVGGKLRAWEIERGTPTPRAAGTVHSDMERGFIKAQVAAFDELVEAGSLARLHDAGKLRTEGKAYAVQDGDVIEFLFSP